MPWLLLYKKSVETVCWGWVKAQLTTCFSFTKKKQQQFCVQPETKSSFLQVSFCLITSANPISPRNLFQTKKETGSQEGLWVLLDQLLAVWHLSWALIPLPSNFWAFPPAQDQQELNYVRDFSLSSKSGWERLMEWNVWGRRGVAEKRQSEM